MSVAPGPKVGADLLAEQEAAWQRCVRTASAPAFGVAACAYLVGAWIVVGSVMAPSDGPTESAAGVDSRVSPFPNSGIAQLAPSDRSESAAPAGRIDPQFFSSLQKTLQDLGASQIGPSNPVYQQPVLDPLAPPLFVPPPGVPALGPLPGPPPGVALDEPLPPGVPLVGALPADVPPVEAPPVVPPPAHVTEPVAPPVEAPIAPPQEPAIAPPLESAVAPPQQPVVAPPPPQPQPSTESLGPAPGPVPVEPAVPAA